MDMEYQMKRLRAFACEDKDGPLSTVVIKDGAAYVTDGRFCFQILEAREIADADS